MRGITYSKPNLLRFDDPGICACVCVYVCVCVSRSVMSNSVTPWTVTHQGPLSMEFSRQEYWSGLPIPSPGGLPDSGIEIRSPALAGGFFTAYPPGKLK